MSLIQVRQCDRCGAKSNPIDDKADLPDGWQSRTLPVAVDELSAVELCADCDEKLIAFVVNRRTNPTVLRCELCPDAEFRSRQALAAHRRIRHPQAAVAAQRGGAPAERTANPPDPASSREPRPVQPTIDPKGPVLGCTDCDVVVHGALTMNRHTESAHGRRALKEERVPLSGKVRAERLAAIGIGADG